MKPSASDNLCMLSPDALLQALHAEFDRLNALHFGGHLSRPEVVLSRRKTYGGYYQPGRKRIVLSLQAYHEHGWGETLNTFRHETAHMVHPDHSPAFWSLAIRLGATQRYAAAPKAARPRPAPRYTYACLSCGRRIQRHRRLRAASCAVCDRRYNPLFALHLVTE